MSQEFFIRSGGRVSGPHSVARLHSLARNGEFSRICEVSVDKRHWRPASEHPELFPKVDGPRFMRPAKPKLPPPRYDDAAAPVEIAEEAFTISAPAEPFAPPGSSDPPDVNGRWFYTRQGREVPEPVAWESLQRMVSTAEVSLQDHVWAEGYHEWVPVGKVPGLATGGSRPGRLDGLAVGSAVVGAIALLLFTGCMIPIALRLRSGEFDLASSPLLIIGSLAALLLAFLALVLGHLRLAASRTAPPVPSTRNAVIAGLIGGYTVVIMEFILTVVVAIYLSQPSA